MIALIVYDCNDNDCVRTSPSTWGGSAQWAASARWVKSATSRTTRRTTRASRCEQCSGDNYIFVNIVNINQHHIRSVHMSLCSMDRRRWYGDELSLDAACEVSGRIAEDWYKEPSSDIIMIITITISIGLTILSLSWVLRASLRSA